MAKSEIIPSLMESTINNIPESEKENQMTETPVQVATETAKPKKMAPSRDVLIIIGVLLLGLISMAGGMLDMEIKIHDLEDKNDHIFTKVIFPAITPSWLRW